MDRKIENARIVSTFLGIEDHGIFIAVLHLDYGSTRQGFGTHDLEYEDYQIGYLRLILEVVGVEKWEDLPGKYIRADHDRTKVYGIGNIIDNKMFYPQGEEVTG